MSKTVLVVDDSTSLRQVVGMTLKSQGFEVIEGCGWVAQSSVLRK